MRISTSWILTQLLSWTQMERNIKTSCALVSHKKLRRCLHGRLSPWVSYQVIAWKASAWATKFQLQIRTSVADTLTSRRAGPATSGWTLGKAVAAVAHTSVAGSRRRSVWKTVSMLLWWIAMGFHLARVTASSSKSSPTYRQMKRLSASCTSGAAAFWNLKAQSWWSTRLTI